MRVWIGNLGKYNEGELVGDWFDLPIDYDDMAERIGLNDYYEEYAIFDTDDLPLDVDQYTSVRELNDMYEIMEELPEYILDELDFFLSYFKDLEDLRDNVDNIRLYPDCDDMEAVAEQIVEENGYLDVLPRNLQYYFDYAALGRDLEIEGKFVRTSYGMCEVEG